ncbi:hypothetical protein [Longimicrobium sp.]|uniref:hypothetical protein n=1 Tax=Longimicrobium sp. TaxID=2029185 RepID=UPI002CDE3652|nr:hypothetical protein [Longimicrobium sp.]HSU14306.1 hypothetical protein [Longimicrobium sp.]
MNTAPPAPPADDLPLVRQEVGHILSQSAAWQQLDPAERVKFARNMERVASYLSRDPGWLDAADPPGSTGMAAPVDDLKKRLAQAPGQVGKDFEAGAMKQGVQEFGNLVQTVDFPAFVSGLIQGVFQAIVDASIQQMEAFGELLAATAKSVGQFADDHIADDQAREQVAQRFPSLVKVDRDEDGTRRLVPASEDGGDTAALQEFARSSERVDLSSAESERKFITAAKLELARQRQKMMALMVMLGINRIVVTNGRINAKVIFDIKASDQAARKATADIDDRDSSEAAAAATTHFGWGAAAGYAKTAHTTTVRSAIDDTSESKAQMKAQLTGEVRVNFKSETIPPERMLDKLQFDQMNYMSGAGGAPAAAPGAPTAPRAAAPAPAPAAPAPQRTA